MEELLLKLLSFFRFFSKMISTFRHHNCSSIPPKTDTVILFTLEEFGEFSDSSQETERKTDVGKKNRCSQLSKTGKQKPCFKNHAWHGVPRKCQEVAFHLLQPFINTSQLPTGRTTFWCKFQESFGFIPWSLTGVGVAGGSIWWPSRKACKFNLDSSQQQMAGSRGLMQWFSNILTVTQGWSPSKGAILTQQDGDSHFYHIGDHKFTFY